MILASDLEQRILETFHYLHEHPEISWEEVKTTNYISRLLSESGCRPRTFEDCTGVIGDYGNFESNLPVIGIRADIDALWQNVKGKDQANHSCGHDAHMSVGLGVLWKLMEHPELRDRVAVRFIFQPAEEKGAGALKMIDKNVMDGVDYLFGVHLRPIQETAGGRAAPVIVHGASKKYSGTIHGEDAHAARPHLNHNAIEICMHLVQLLNQIHLDPRVPYSVKMTRLFAGGKSANIIPGRAQFTLDLRAQTNELMQQLEGRVNEIFDTLRHYYHVPIELTDIHGIVAAKLNEEAIQIMKRSIEEVLGKDQVDEPLITPGGDDFHFYTVHNPKLKATMLGLGCNLKPGLHHPDMAFDHAYLINGTDILYQAILNVYGLTK